MKINNAHCHLGLEYDRSNISLKTIFDTSYVGWLDKVTDETPQGIARFLERNKPTQAFRQLVKSLERLYGNGSKLGADTWQYFDEQIKKVYADAGYESRVLKNLCGYEHMLLDDYYNIGNYKFGSVDCDLALRCDFLFYGYSKEALNSSEAIPFDFFDNIPDNLNDYLDKMQNYLEQIIVADSCYSMKVCMAYFRGLDFSQPSLKDAEKIYQNPDNPQYITYFQDYIMHRLCDIAAKYNIPIQMHTGLGQLERTSISNLLPLINSHPDTKFMLLHGGFPWTDDLLGALYGCPNTYLDICWMPLLSETIAKNTLISVIELVGADRIVWGCDASTVEESYGALLAAFDLLQEVTDYFVGKGFFDKNYGKKLVEKILYSNAQRIFHFK